MPVIVTFGVAASALDKSTFPSSQTTVSAVTIGQLPELALALTPSRPTVVVNVIRTDVSAAAPAPAAAPGSDNVIVCVTGCPGAAPKGLDVNTGTASTEGDGVAMTAPVSAAAIATTGTAFSGDTPAPYPRRRSLNRHDHI